jgi:hypothetical protein
MTHQQLQELLDRKNRMAATWRSFVHTSRDNMKLEDEVNLDISTEKALRASCLADNDYKAALLEFIDDVKAEEAP